MGRPNIWKDSDREENQFPLIKIAGPYQFMVQVQEFSAILSIFWNHSSRIWKINPTSKM